MTDFKPGRAAGIAAKVEAFVRNVVIPFEKDPRRDHHGGPTDELVTELKELARAAGVLTPHILDHHRDLHCAWRFSMRQHDLSSA